VIDAAKLDKGDVVEVDLVTGVTTSIKFDSS
jgi:hypothetical protein